MEQVEALMETLQELDDKTPEDEIISYGGLMFLTLPDKVKN